MIIEKEVTKISSDWMSYLHTTIVSNRGKFEYTNDSGELIILEWEKVNPLSPRINELAQEVCVILGPTYASMELQFARAYPETVSKEMFLKPLEPLFLKGSESVDWEAAKEILQGNFRQFFTKTDFAPFAKPGEVQLFIKAKEARTNDLLGVITFNISPEYEYGTVKVGWGGISASPSAKDIEKVLMSSIFALLPKVEKIFLHTRITNERALELYRQWNFTHYPGPLPYWVDREYLANRSDTLQKTAQSLKGSSL